MYNSHRQKHLVILLGVSRGPEPTEFEMCVTDSGYYRSSVPAFAVVASARKVSRAGDGKVVFRSVWSHLVDAGSQVAPTRPFLTVVTH